MASRASYWAMAAKDQHPPQVPCFLIGVIQPYSLQSKLGGGRNRLSEFDKGSEDVRRRGGVGL